MTQQQITDQIDATLSQYLPAIQGKQEAFRSANGRYFQGLPSCSQVPADGTAAVTDQWDTTPSYQGVTWREAWGGDPPAMTSSLRIDQYDGPEGQGWTITAQVLIGGVLWQRVVNFGPENWRGQTWAAVQGV